MTSKDKVLSYCQYCSNRSFDSDIGVYCSLTEEKPTFKENCPDFDKDIKLILDRGDKITFVNQYTTGLWDKVKDLFHQDVDSENLENVSIHYSKFKFILTILLGITAGTYSIYYLISTSLNENTGDAVEVIIVSSILILIIFLREFKRTFFDANLIQINSDGLRLSNQLYDWREIVSFVIVDEKNEYGYGVNSFLEIESIGMKEDIRVEIDALNISKHDLVNLLTNVQKRYIAPAHR